MQNVKDDIAFMRALAAEGQRTPMLGGAIMAAAGVIFAIASLAYWALTEGMLVLDPNWGSFIIWMGALAVFLVVLTVINLRIGRKPGASSPTNKAKSWFTVGNQTADEGSGFEKSKISKTSIRSAHRPS